VLHAACVCEKAKLKLCVKSKENVAEKEIKESLKYNRLRTKRLHVSGLYLHAFAAKQNNL